MILKRLCEDIYHNFILSQKTYNRDIYNKLDKLSNYVMHNKITEELLETIFQLERKVMSEKGPNRKIIEEHILELLSSIAWKLIPNQVNGNKIILKNEIIVQINNTDKIHRHRLALKLSDFVFDIYTFKKPRDSFRTLRRALCIQILDKLSQSYEIPEALDLCLSALDAKKEDSTLAAIDFLKNYYLDNKLSLSKSIIDKLDKIVKKTNSRYVATSALDLQVKTGHISEMEALFRLENWKRENLF